MLKYLIAVTGALLTTAVLIGMLYACLPASYGKRGQRFLTAGVVAGLLAALVMSVLKNTSSLVVTGAWNTRIFSVSLIVLVIWYVFSIDGLRKKARAVGETVHLLMAAILVGGLLFYALPDVYAYPFTFSFGSESVFSSAYILRFIGWIMGLVLVVVTCLAVCRGTERLKPRTAKLLLNLALLVNGLQQASKLIQVLLSRRIIRASHPLYHTFFRIAKFTSNHSNLFIYLMLVVAVMIPIILWVRSFHVNEPYENPAQRRKIKAAWRSTRRWSTLILGCFIVGVLCLTVFYAIDNKPVELSPSEEVDVRGEEIYVPLTQVEDGNLHRFVYHTPNGVDVRFIVVKKPNSSAYGVGLDACEICGEAGYFQRGDQIVCKKCDVVMNINTIGFKGGCNPIVIDYSVHDGYIIVPTYTLIDHEEEFK